MIESRADEVVMEIVDDGPRFDPLNPGQVPSVFAQPTEHAPGGGFGLHLVRSMADRLAYCYAAGRNRVTVVARRE